MTALRRRQPECCRGVRSAAALVGFCGACDHAVKSVMVPGGWQGGWVFDSVAAELHRDGHHVEAVTQSGLELDGPADVDRPPNLDTHIDQVAEIIDRSDETPLALCGHSFGGMVIAGVADRLSDRLDQLVFWPSAPMRLLEAFLGTRACTASARVRMGGRIAVPT